MTLEHFVIQAPETAESFAAYLRVRYETLREPWGEPAGTERVEDDDDALHRMVIDARCERVAGVARLHYNSPQEAQIRLMGIAQPYQKMGLGRVLMTEMERIAQQQGRTQMVLHARDYAVGFYEKLGYEAQGESYLLMGVIQHYFMSKTLGTPC